MAKRIHRSLLPERLAPLSILRVDSRIRKKNAFKVIPIIQYDHARAIRETVEKVFKNSLLSGVRNIRIVCGKFFLTGDEVFQERFYVRSLNAVGGVRAILFLQCNSFDNAM